MFCLKDFSKSTATPLNIAGIDYSAAKEPHNNTWICSGTLNRAATSQESKEPNCELILSTLTRTGSENLINEIKAVNINSQGNRPFLVGLDFPFGFPAGFCHFLLENQASALAAKAKSGVAAITPRQSTLVTSQNIQTPELLASESDAPADTWLHVAQALAQMSFEEFDAIRLKFGAEPKRLTDSRTQPKAQSPLHRINPGMLKMTWQGQTHLMQLRELGLTIAPFETLPADSTTPKAAMEVYPSACLAALGLPFQKYKGTSPEAKNMRKKMLLDLLQLHTVKHEKFSLAKLTINAEIADLAIKDDNAFDALIAAYNTALLFLNPEKTAQPAAKEARAATLEGWIYVL